MDLGTRLSLQETCLDELLAVLGVDWAEEPDPRVERFAEREPLYPQYHRIGHKRQSAFRALNADRALAERHYEVVLRALVHDDDLSSPRWLASALVAVGGRRRLQERLVGVVEHGTPYEQACAVGGWHWAEASPDAQARFVAACNSALAGCTDPWARERLEALARSRG